MKTNINIDDIKDIFGSGARNIEVNKALVDSLNVFPVPDGDTGTNMNLTMAAALREIKSAEYETISDVCQAFSRGALKGARGNSGVILSQILKGMAEELSKPAIVNTKTFAAALRRGAVVAYDVVTHPKEGTILTVIRLVSEYAVKIAPKKSDFIEFLKLILKKGNEVLDDTPNLLPVLKKAGVVDAGGKGLLLIFEGMYNKLAGIEIVEPSEDSVAVATEIGNTFAPDIHNLEEIEFAYCTEFFIINLKPITTLADIKKLKERLLGLGDCVIVVGDLSLVKVHIHTNTPDKVLGYALTLGELEKPKIENMLEQGRAFKKEIEQKQTLKESAMVSICSGDGIKEIFEELNVDAVLEGGQTMNPSVSDIVGIAEKVKAKTVYILPNNSNIILAAEQAKELTSCNLVVIATKNIPQGIAAAINYDPDADALQNAKEMQRAAEAVRSGQVTSAVRDAEMDGFDLKNGDVIGIYHKIAAKGTDINEVALELAALMTDDTTSAITVYYGEDVPDEKADALSAELAKKYAFYDVSVYYGGQGHYHYFLAVE